METTEKCKVLKTSNWWRLDKAFGAHKKQQQQQQKQMETNKTEAPKQDSKKEKKRKREIKSNKNTHKNQRQTNSGNLTERGNGVLSVKEKEFFKKRVSINKQKTSKQNQGSQDWSKFADS